MFNLKISGLKFLIRSMRLTMCLQCHVNVPEVVVNPSVLFLMDSAYDH